MLRVLAPRFWGAHLLVVLLAAAAGWLGLWQFHAWQATRAAAAVELTAVDPIPLADALGPDEPFPGDMVGQPVIVEGTWVPTGTVYVSGHRSDGQDGFWVVTPVAVGEPDGPALLVVRGWTADQATAPAPPGGSTELVAWLQPPQGTGQVDKDPTDDVLPQLRIADAIQHVDQDLYGAYAVVTDQVADGPWPSGARARNAGTAGLTRAALDTLPDTSSLTALRNLLYAVQWWLFGGFAVFIWWRYLTDAMSVPPTESLG